MLSIEELIIPQTKNKERQKMKKITRNLSTQNIVSVNFFTGQPSHYFFGSLSAIFEMFTPEQVGCTLDYLWNKERFANGHVITKTCVISKHKLYRKSNKH